MTSPSVLSLFAGIGGIDLGLEAIGCTTRWYSEVDPYACMVMAARFPDATNLGDITTINWSELDERPDIICGGFPCQDISLAGKGAGITEGTRSGLWAYYADAIRILRPRGVLVENVAALTSRGLDRVLGDLAACGYDAEWDCVPAAAVGAPHLRDRLFVIAYRADVESEHSDAEAMHGLAVERHESHGDNERTAAPGADAERISSERRGTTGNVVGASGAGEADREQWERDGDAVEHLRAARSDTHCGRFEVSEECVSDQTRRIHSEQRDDTHGLRGPDERRQAASDADCFGGNGSAAEHGTHRRQEPTRNHRPGTNRASAGLEWAGIPRRLADVCAGQWPRPIGADWWSVEPGVGRVAHGIPKRVDRLRCLGNAVVPQVAEHVGRVLLDRLDAKGGER